MAETLFALALTGIHLSRLGEDAFTTAIRVWLSRWTTVTAGSSLMQQKRNADPLELARGKAGRLIGNLTGLLTTLKGLPSAYNKDLQEDKEALFDAVDTLQALLPVLTAVVHTLQVNPERMRAALDEECCWRRTWQIIWWRRSAIPRGTSRGGGCGTKVFRSGASPVTAAAGGSARMQPALRRGRARGIRFDTSVRSRSAAGGPAPATVAMQLAEAQAVLAL